MIDGISSTESFRLGARQKGRTRRRQTDKEDRLDRRKGVDQSRIIRDIRGEPTEKTNFVRDSTGNVGQGVTLTVTNRKLESLGDYGRRDEK